MNRLAPIIAALDERTAPLHLFVRNDDAGWDDARLFALLDCTARADVPIDLAVIPDAIGASLAHELRARSDANPGRIGLHQHGFAHINREPAGRKCEFGPAREIAAQRRDLQLGRARLHDLFEHRIDPFFTPPWNRCAPATPALLAGLGYTALSRDHGAPAQYHLPELPVDIDWCKLRKLSPQPAESIAETIRKRGTPDEPLGLMLHHAQMDASDLALLCALLDALAHHPHARWVSMNELLRARTPAVATSPADGQRQTSRAIAPRSRWHGETR